MTTADETETGTSVFTCSECGHLHYTHEGYLPCPLADEGCACDLDDTDVCERCMKPGLPDDMTWCDRFGTVHRDCEHESDCRCQMPRTPVRW